MARGNPVVRQGRARGEQRQLDLDPAALFVEEALATEELQERMSVSVIHDCLTGVNCLYNLLLLGAVYDTKELTANTMDCATGMWLNPLPDSRNGFGAVISESSFATGDFDYSECPHIINSKKIEEPPTSFANAERLHYEDVWNDSDSAEFSGLWNSNAIRRLKKAELLKNANVTTGKWTRHWKTDGHGNVIKSKSRMVARSFGQIHNITFPKRLLLPH